MPNFKTFHLLFGQLLGKLGLLLDWLLENIILLNPLMIFLEQSNITQTKVKQKKYA